jgi:CRP-like cAMP-binding protein
LRIARDVSENTLLAGLPSNTRRNVLRSCEQVELQFAEVLYQPDERMRHVYFPTGGFVSLVAVLDDGGQLEVGIVGSEGLVGISLILGVDLFADRAIVQRQGAALRMSASAFRRHYTESHNLRATVHRYIHVSMTQLAQTAACTSYHLVEERLARWLLISRDRAHSDEFHLTHEFLAYMLGVRRVGVTEAAAALQARGLITYRRGDITIVNSAGLKKASCACYERGNQIYEATMKQGLKSAVRVRAGTRRLPGAR